MASFNVVLLDLIMPTTDQTILRNNYFLLSSPMQSRMDDTFSWGGLRYFHPQESSHRATHTHVLNSRSVHDDYFFRRRLCRTARRKMCRISMQQLVAEQKQVASGGK